VLAIASEQVKTVAIRPRRFIVIGVNGGGTASGEGALCPAGQSGWRGCRSLLGVLAICLALRLWLIVQGTVIAEDGTLYVELAREWSRDPGAALRESPVHPGYPATVAAVHRILTRLSISEGVGRWDLAGQSVSLAASLAAMVALWLFARLSYGGRIAWVAGLLFGVGRKWSALGADVLTDASALCFELWSVVFAILAGRRLRRNRRMSLMLAGAAGACAGIGYLFRPEAAFVFVPALCLWLWYGLRKRASWSTILGGIGVALAVQLACMVPYMLVCGGFTGKWSLDELALRDHGANAPVALAMVWAPLELSRVLVSKLFEAIHPVLGFGALIYLMMWLGRQRLRRMLREGIRWVPSAETVVVTAGWALTVLPMVIFRGTRLSLSHRYLLLLAAMLAPTGAAGLVVMAEAGAAAFRQRRKANLWAGLLVAILAVGMTVHALRPPHAGKAYYRQAGDFMTGTSKPDEFVLTNERRIRHYCQTKGFVIWHEAFDSRQGFYRYLAERPYATYLALSVKELARQNPRSPEWFRPPAFREIRAFVQDRSKDADEVRIYRIDHHELAGLASQ